MPDTTHELDLRRLPHEMRHGLVFQCFDSLKTGDALVIINDHDPMPLLQQFKFVRPGESEYEYLQRGPTAWQVRIARKAAGLQPQHEDLAAPAERHAEGDGPSSVTEYLEADHRRLDAILPEVERLAGAGSYEEAATRLGEFTSGLDRHIEIEEQILFPAFERITGMAGGPTIVMRSEHVDIRNWMREATSAVANQDAALLAEALGGLSQSLSVHNMKEEHMLYPMTDQAAGESRRELVSRMQAF